LEEWKKWVHQNCMKSNVWSENFLRRITHEETVDECIAKANEYPEGFMKILYSA
jgi:hypothetical protein